jgi:F0F1-type ATP synthase alpha subunit
MQDFEAELIKFVANSHPGLLQAIREQKSLTDEIKSDLAQVLKDFKDNWTEMRASASAAAAR